MTKALVLVGCWPRRMSADLAAVDCGEPSAGAFLNRVGPEYSRPCVREGSRELWLREQYEKGVNGWSFRLRG
jgi:hypothetical protein